MTRPSAETNYPQSEAFRRLQRLRIPGGWHLAINKLADDMPANLGDVGGSSQFHATNAGTRFNIDVEFIPEFDPIGAFHLSVWYQPWPRTERGRRRKDVPFAMTAEAQLVHHLETASYDDLVEQLEHWIARCTVWVREGS